VIVLLVLILVVCEMCECQCDLHCFVEVSKFGQSQSAIFLAINKLKVRRILPSAILITVCQRTYNMVFGCISMCTV